MIYRHILIALLAFSFLACSSSEKSEETSSETSNEWELQVLDSIQVDYLADVREGTFNDGIGIIKDIMSTTLVKFDTTGKILAKKVYSMEGPENVKSLETSSMPSV